MRVCACVYVYDFPVYVCAAPFIRGSEDNLMESFSSFRLYG